MLAIAAGAAPEVAHFLVVWPSGQWLVDLQVYPLLWFLGRTSPEDAPGPAAWGLCGAAVLFNLYGAVYMLGV